MDKLDLSAFSLEELRNLEENIKSDMTHTGAENIKRINERLKGKNLSDTANTLKEFGLSVPDELLTKLVDTAVSSNNEKIEKIEKPPAILDDFLMAVQAEIRKRTIS